MDYEQIPEDLRAQLEATRFSAVRYSSRADEADDKVNDVLLLAKGSPIDVDKLEGYTVTSNVKVWYDFVSRPYREAGDAANCLKVVTEALAA